MIEVLTFTELANKYPNAKEDILALKESKNHAYIGWFVLGFLFGLSLSIGFSYVS